MTSINQTSKKFNNKRKAIWIIIGCLAVLIALFFYNKVLIKAYYYDFKSNHLSKGDKVYAKDVFLNDKPSETLSFFRLAKSTTSSKILILRTKKEIVNDSLHKYKTACIATYIDNVFVPATFHDRKGMTNMFAVLPNWKMTKGANALYNDMPEGYEFFDNNFYIYQLFVTDNESPAFLKK